MKLFIVKAAVIGSWEIRSAHSTMELAQQAIDEYQKSDNFFAFRVEEHELDKKGN